MRKIAFYLAAGIALTSFLAGCGRSSEKLEERMLKKSGILEDTDYLTYEGYVNEGRINDNGYFIDTAEEPVKSHAPIHVTFASNSNLKIQYYSDAEHRVVLDQAACYLNPGDSVYASVEIKDDVFSSMYEFAGFRCYEYEENGSKKAVDFIEINNIGPDYVLSVSPDYMGSELAIEPIGTYRNRSIVLRDYSIDDAGNKKDTNGTWLINDKAYDSKTVEISPVSSYIISYQYNSNDYFFLSSEPECYYSNNTDGIVIFKQRRPEDSTLDYTVELHKYISVTLVSDKDRTVRVNSGENKSVAANTEVTVSKLRYGQPVVITTNKEWNDLKYCRDLILTGYRRDAGYYTYTMIVPEKDGAFLFDPADYSYAHGTLTFTCFGSDVSGPQMLAKGSKIYYKQNTADAGYWLAPGDDNFIIVGEEETTKQQLREIHFTPKVQVTVSLRQPPYGGTVIYKVDGNRINTDSYSTFSGTVIEMEFKPWVGWILNSDVHSGDTYTVRDSKNQIATVNGFSIDKIFSEDKDHKPALTVTLEKSVGTEMEFSISASGLSTDISNYGGGWNVTDVFTGNISTYNLWENSQDIINQQTIGSESPITIQMGNKALHNGQAVRVVIVRTADNKYEETETRYITDMTAAPAPIDIYNNDGERSVSGFWYKSVHITIGVVKIETFRQPKPSEHSIVTVRNMQTRTVMTGGELIEGDTKVTVTIAPEFGYYITGKNVTVDTYQETMKYSVYLEKKYEIIARHPVGKYYMITLDASDPYAVYTYKLDGRNVSGTIAAREGQTLTLTYEVKDPAYKLREGSGGFLGTGLGKSYTIVSKDLAITPDLDGNTVTKADFGIAVVRGA